MSNPSEEHAVSDQTLVWLGNPAPLEIQTARNPDGSVQTYPDGREVRRRVPLPGGPRVTLCAPVGALAAFLRELTDPAGIWRAHSAAPGPSWVACTDPDWATVIGHALGCPSIPADEAARAYAGDGHPDTLPTP